MYPSTSLFIAIGQLAIVVLIMFSYPLQVQPCRICLDKIFHAGDPVKVPSGDDDDEEVMDDEHAATDMSFFKHTLLTAGIIGGSFVIAYFVDNLQMGISFCQYAEEILIFIATVLSFVGTIGSTTISFILPGLLYWKVRTSYALLGIVAEVPCILALPRRS